MAIERDLAVALSGIDDEGRVMRAVTEALAPPHRVCGIAIAADLSDGKKVEARGPFAASAREALDSTSERGKLSHTATVVSFGDERGGRGCIAWVAPESGGYDPAIACSLERIGTMLSATLLRIETTKRLDAALRDRELLMREIRHRVRNSLQLVINLVPLMLNGEPRFSGPVLGDFEKRITTLISIHDMLSWTETKDLICARTYFWMLADALRRVTADGIGTLVSTYESDEDPELPVDRATTIGLVVYELVVNSAKHARGKPVRMDLRVGTEERTLILRYSDRPPRPESCKADAATSAAAATSASAATSAAAEQEATYGSHGRTERGEGLGMELMSALLSRARGERSDDRLTPHFFEARFPLD
jgi:two-component sensor histidine kinase